MSKIRTFRGTQQNSNQNSTIQQIKHQNFKKNGKKEEKLTLNYIKKEIKN